MNFSYGALSLWRFVTVLPSVSLVRLRRRVCPGDRYQLDALTNTAKITLSHLFYGHFKTCHRLLMRNVGQMTIGKTHPRLLVFIFSIYQICRSLHSIAIFLTIIIIETSSSSFQFTFFNIYTACKLEPYLI